MNNRTRYGIGFYPHGCISCKRCKDRHHCPICSPCEIPRYNTLNLPYTRQPYLTNHSTIIEIKLDKIISLLNCLINLNQSPSKSNTEITQSMESASPRGSLTDIRNEDKTPSSIPLSDKDYIVKGEDRGSNICRNCTHEYHLSGTKGCCEVWVKERYDDGDRYFDDICGCNEFTPQEKR